MRSTVTAKTIVQHSNQCFSTGFKAQTQSTSVNFYQKINNSEKIESTYPTKVTVISIPTSPFLISGFTITLQIPKITIRNNFDVYKEPKASEKITSHDNYSSVSSHQFHIQKTAHLRISQFKRTRR